MIRISSQWLVRLAFSFLWVLLVSGANITEAYTMMGDVTSYKEDGYNVTFNCQKGKVRYIDFVKAFKDIRPGSKIPYKADVGLSVDTPALGLLGLAPDS